MHRSNTLFPGCLTTGGVSNPTSPDPPKQASPIHSRDDGEPNVTRRRLSHHTAHEPSRESEALQLQSPQNTKHRSVQATKGPNVTQNQNTTYEHDLEHTLETKHPSYKSISCNYRTQLNRQTHGNSSHRGRQCPLSLRIYQMIRHQRSHRNRHSELDKTASVEAHCPYSLKRRQRTKCHTAET